MMISFILLAIAGCVNAAWLYHSQLPIRLPGDPLKVPGRNVLSYCEDPEDDILAIEYIHFEPNPPVPGQNLTMTFHGTLYETISFGSKVHLSVKWGYVHFINGDYDLCDYLGEDDDLKCPLHKGPFTLIRETPIPKEAPGGTYYVTADASNKAGDRVTCVKGEATFS